MMKVLVRIIGAGCLVAAVFIAFTAAWLQLDNVTSSDLRTAKKSTLQDMEMVKIGFLAAYDLDPNIKAELENANLPDTKTSIKRRFSETESLLDKWFSGDISLAMVYELCGEAPRYLEDTSSLLNSNIPDTVFGFSKNFTTLGMDEVIDEAIMYDEIFDWAKIILLVFIGLGALAAFTQLFRPTQFVKYFFIVLLGGMAIASYVIVPSLSDEISGILFLNKDLENLGLTVTMSPLFAFVLSLVPVVLDIIFERNKGKKPERSAPAPAYAPAYPNPVSPAYYNYPVPPTPVYNPVPPAQPQYYGAAPVQAPVPAPQQPAPAPQQPAPAPAIPPQEPKLKSTIPANKSVPAEPPAVPNFAADQLSGQPDLYVAELAFPTLESNATEQSATTDIPLNTQEDPSDVSGV